MNNYPLLRVTKSSFDFQRLMRFRNRNGVRGKEALNLDQNDASRLRDKISTKGKMPSRNNNKSLYLVTTTTTERERALKSRGCKCNAGCYIGVTLATSVSPDPVKDIS